MRMEIWWSTDGDTQSELVPSVCCWQTCISIYVYRRTSICLMQTQISSHKHWNTVQLLHLTHFYSVWFAPNICTLHISVHVHICTYANICTYMCTSVHICTCTIVHSAMVDNDICQSSKGKHAPVAQPWLAVSFVFALFKISLEFTKESILKHLNVHFDIYWHSK